MFYKVLVRFRVCSHNPAMDIEKAKIEKNRQPVFLQKQFLDACLQLVKGRYIVRDVAIIALMAYAGLRVSEIVRLNITDFDRFGSKMSVLGKGEKWRYIPLPEELRYLLQMSLDQRIKPRNKKDEPAFFISQFGRRISKRMVQTIADKTFEALAEKYPQFKGVPYRLINCAILLLRICCETALICALSRNCLATRTFLPRKSIRTYWMKPRNAP
ncbi:hypothetical protein HMSSN036_01280 [Paenibacillus macerans]|nr:hypothetical protein HMSSN036_01280 [Paenibacillus macerans]